MTTIKPTIGRVVWFYPSTLVGKANFALPRRGEPLAAIISHVWSDVCVNLAVFDADGASHSQRSVRLVQDDEPVPKDGYYCEWMPYQKGQAAKTDHLQELLKPATVDKPAIAYAGDAAIEQEIQTKGKTAPRITPAEIDANVMAVEIVKHVTQSGQVLRWAILTTRCGFAVVGKPSCAVSAENDDTAIGEKVAIDNSRSELWPLMGYALKEQLATRT